MKTIVLFLSAIFTLGVSRAQFSQDFEAPLSTITGDCWTIVDIFRTTTPGDVINGNASMYTNPPVNGAGTRDISSPALKVNAGNLVISFNYKLSSVINGNATRTIQIGLLDVLGNFTSLDMVTLDKNTPGTVQNYNNTFNMASAGLYKMMLKLGGTQGDGNSRLIFDDLFCSASPLYGGGTCNTAPIAVNDVFTGIIGNMVTGNVMTNDNEPNGEGMVAAIVVTSPNGIVVLNPNGSFVFTPNPGFVGSFTTFTYQLTDDGFSPATSNIATVTINFTAAGPLPVKLASFTATLNNNKADLKWTTTTEINVSHFVIEKSIDGTTFNDAGVVLAYGNATDRTNYSFTDNLNTTSAKLVYYRLRSVDMDTKSELSETRIIRLSKENSTSIAILAYPNPVVNDLRITVPANWQNKSVVFEVIGANGNTLQKKEIASCGQTETLNVSQLVSGFYFVRVNCDGQIAVQKIIKN